MKLITIILLTLTMISSYSQTFEPGPQVLTFFSDLDDTEQPYSIYIPKNYDENKKYPLVVMLHGSGSNHRLALRRVFGKSNLNGETDVEASLYFPEWKDIDAFVVAPYARGTAGYQGIVEKDVMDMLADVRKRFSIDENRTYLTGLSMGGGGTLWIGLSHPDLWAAIAPVCPSPPEGVDVLAPNALNMAVHFFHGDMDMDVPVTISREWVADLKKWNTARVDYKEYPGVAHSSWVQAYENGQVFDWLFQFTRNPYPDRVRHASPDLAHGKSYWVRFDEKESGQTAFADVVFENTNTIDIRTEHLNALTLTLDNHPKYDPTSALRVIIDGSAFLIPAGSVADNNFSFHKATAGWAQGSKADNAVHKTAGLEGPVVHAFSTRHIYVYGTLDNPSGAELRSRMFTAMAAADWSHYRGEFLGRIKFYPRVLADHELRQSDYESSNLILFGTKETNRVIAEMADQLPIHLDLKATSEYGLTYIYPNTYGKYVIVNSGIPWWNAREAHNDYLPDRYFMLFGFQDFIFYQRNKKAIVEGYFNNDWTVSEENKRELLANGIRITNEED